MFMFPTWLKLMDFQYNEGEISAKLGNYRGHLSMQPSGYFARNCGIGASCVRRADIENRHEIGLDQIMWGSDYPHPEGTWPHTSRYYEETFSGIPEKDGRKILGGNAVRFYGLDEPRLRSVADRIGPEASIFQ